jgi:hypothetical protein
MSPIGVVETAGEALSIGIIIAIAVGSAVGLAILIGIIICLYCVCCRKSKRYPGAVIQTQPYPGPAYNNQSMNRF